MLSPPPKFKNLLQSYANAIIPSSLSFKKVDEKVINMID